MKKLKDMIGKTFGVWMVESCEGSKHRKVVDPLAKTRPTEIFWTCICECGNKGQYNTSTINQAIKAGKMKRCPHIGNVLLGTKKGRLTATKFITGKHRAKLLCTCACGNQTFVDPTTFDKGIRTSCGCVDRYPLSIAAFYKIPFEEVDTTKADLHKQVYRCKQSHRQHGKKRVVEWKLPLDLCEQIVQKPCTYCNLKAVEQKKGYSGIDRIDSKGHYEPTNVVPCCTTCNTMKMQLTQAQFKAWISRIYNHYCQS